METFRVIFITKKIFTVTFAKLIISDRSDGTPPPFVLILILSYFYEYCKRATLLTDFCCIRVTSGWKPHWGDTLVSPYCFIFLFSHFSANFFSRSSKLGRDIIGILISGKRGTIEKGIRKNEIYACFNGGVALLELFWFFLLLLLLLLS